MRAFALLVLAMIISAYSAEIAQEQQSVSVDSSAAGQKTEDLKTSETFGFGFYAGGGYPFYRGYYMRPYGYGYYGYPYRRYFGYPSYGMRAYPAFPALSVWG